MTFVWFCVERKHKLFKRERDVSFKQKMAIKLGQ